LKRATERNVRRVALFAVALAPFTAVAAQQRVVSPGPDSLSVTVYRNPARSIDDEMNLNWLGGYALVTETRTVDLPSGTSDIRLEGVADTLLPASVIISGLPHQPDEKNYDARLLSPGALIDANLGRQVHIRRTFRKTGKVTETEAIIRSGPNGIVLQTPAGIEALSCTGLNEKLVYDQVPPDLSEKPTLSIRASTPSPVRTTVRLSYLATQFDWRANYIASLDPGGQTLELFAWLTLANGNDASFPSAQTQAIAGAPNRTDEPEDNRAQPVSPTIRLQCWPAGTTSDVTSIPPPPPPPPGVQYRDGGDEIVVTGTMLRKENLMSAAPVAVIAQQEELGDLKLYRIPELVTVASHAQKQVALLVKEHVPYERYYGLSHDARREVDDPEPVPIKIRMKNLKARGLGIPLPSGTVAIFETVDHRPMLVGEPRMPDNAVGEDVELEVGESPDVTYTQKPIGEGDDDKDGNERARQYRLEISNARSVPGSVEVELRTFGDYRIAKPSRSLGVKNGRAFWKAKVPANGRTSLTYTVQPIRNRKRSESD
jgi:hypothetical protein